MIANQVSRRPRARHELARPVRNLHEHRLDLVQHRQQLADDAGGRVERRRGRSEDVLRRRPRRQRRRVGRRRRDGGGYGSQPRGENLREERDGVRGGLVVEAHERVTHAPPGAVQAVPRADDGVQQRSHGVADAERGRVGVRGGILGDERGERAFEREMRVVRDAQVLEPDGEGGRDDGDARPGAEPLEEEPVGDLRRRAHKGASAEVHHRLGRGAVGRGEDPRPLELAPAARVGRRGRLRRGGEEGFQALERRRRGRGRGGGRRAGDDDDVIVVPEQPRSSTLEASSRARRGGSLGG